jgi:hypothetical protein
MATIEMSQIDLEAQRAATDTERRGYSLLGRLMGDYPGVAIFRSFSSFSAENLLYLQAELVALEDDLRQAQKEDRTSPHRERRQYGVNWTQLNESLEREDSSSGREDGTQWATILDMREKLKEYRA